MGIDDVTSECDLDAFLGWDYQIQNDCGKSPDELWQDVLPLIDQVISEEML